MREKGRRIEKKYKRGVMPKERDTHLEKETQNGDL